jgi:predicted outer membrane protein
MFGRAGRILPALAAGIAALLVATSSFALAAQHNHTRHTRHHARSTGRFSAWDEQWLMMSIQGDRFEIEGGMLAQQRGQNEKVKALGARLVTDHTKSLRESVVVARRLGIKVPDSPSPTQQWELRAVSQFSGNQFDRWYSDLEVQDHIQDITEARDEVHKGRNDRVQHLAASDLPVLKQHLALAQDALATVTTG